MSFPEGEGRVELMPLFETPEPPVELATAKPSNL